MGVVPLALKKLITARNSHLAGEASRSSIVNSCPFKTEHHSGLGFMRIWRGRAKLHTNIYQISHKAFLTAPAPWRPYFMDMPPTLVKNFTVLILCLFEVIMQVWNKNKMCFLKTVKNDLQRYSRQPFNWGEKRRYSSEGMAVKLKLSYFGHVMWKDA